MICKLTARNQSRTLRKQLFFSLGNDCIDIKFLKNVIFLISKKLKIKYIGIYFPINSEISPLKIFKIKKFFDLKVCLPVINADSLKFFPWNLGEELYKTNYGTFEPKNKNLEVIPEVIFVPFLAYDKSFNRLGYGGGFYDKTILKLRTISRKKINSFIAIGIGYDKQEIKNVPIDNLDQKMDIIVTEKKIMYRKKI
tara:strand:+ start:166 stop:753 length:588 start_codon:yes stop_codon:yes gene_type:complete